jgi:hypothetical protein
MLLLSSVRQVWLNGNQRYDWPMQRVHAGGNAEILIRLPEPEALRAAESLWVVPPIPKVQPARTMPKDTIESYISVVSVAGTSYVGRHTGGATNAIHIYLPAELLPMQDIKLH